VDRFRVLSFDVEEHHRIEAAAGLAISRDRKSQYRERMETTTRRLLDLLARAETRATFFVVGDIARTAPALVRDIHNAGHEVGSHGWKHTRVDRLTPASFRDDARNSKDALEQVTGTVVRGFRAPTFSIAQRTPWAIDVLAECGYEYDSSIFPVHHDRYGVPRAPRGPFVAAGREHELLELPPLTYRKLGLNWPVAGGGYFRLFPLGIMRAGIRQAESNGGPSVAVLYFHPWEFDEDQPRLPLGRLARWRTYVGIRRTARRLQSLLSEYSFTRAIDAARALGTRGADLPRFRLGAEGERTTPILGRIARI
jgi:polysaccharide deacetylase family protein (PEP-CTERM system associated)